MSIYFELFFSFLKIGLLTFGGGIAMLPMLERELVENKKWVTQEEILDYFAIGQCTPGVIAVNTATFVGQKLKGVPGGIVATLGMISTSLIIIDVIAALLSNYMTLPAVISAFAGIKVVVCVLILNAFIKLAKKAVVDIPTAVILVAVIGLSIFLDISPVVFVVLAAISGVVVKNIAEKNETEVKK